MRGSVYRVRRYEVKRKRKGRFGRRVLVLCFVLIILYTLWAMWEQHRTGIEPSPVLTQWLYTFFGIECALLCLKRIFAKSDEKEAEAAERKQRKQEEQEHV